MSLVARSMWLKPMWSSVLPTLLGGVPLGFPQEHRRVVHRLALRVPDLRLEILRRAQLSHQARELEGDSVGIAEIHRSNPGLLVRLLAERIVAAVVDRDDRDAPGTETGQDLVELLLGHVESNVIHGRDRRLCAALAP